MNRIAWPVLIILALFSSTSYAAKSMPRIYVKKGAFYQKGSNQRFLPIGFNFANNRKNIPGKVQAHATFGPDKYNKEEIRKLFADCKEGGFNLIRVFLDSNTKLGYVESKASKRLNPVYVANVINFLQQARKHGVYVTFTTDRWLPDSDWLRGTSKPGKEAVKGYNNLYFNETNLRLRGRVMAEFIKAIKKHDRDLLSVVFGWQIENEMVFDIGQEPFKSRKRFRFRGKTYDLSKVSGLIALCDDNAMLQAKYGAEAIRKEDPQAMVGMGLYTPMYNWYAEPKEMAEGKYPNHHLPGRALAYIKSGKLQFLGLHVYLFDIQDQSIEGDWKIKAGAYELNEILAASKKHNVGYYLEEFGAHTKTYVSPTKAAPYMAETIALAIEAGFQGFLPWKYNDDPEWMSPNLEGKFLYRTYQTVKNAIEIEPDGSLSIDRTQLPKPPAPKKYTRTSVELFGEGVNKIGQWQSPSFAKTKKGGVDLSIDKKIICAKVRNSEHCGWSVISPPFKGEVGKTYELSFDVRTDGSRFALRAAQCNMWKYNKPAKLNVSEEYRRVVIIGSPEQLNGDKIHLKMDIPQDSTVYIQNLKAYEVEEK